MDCPVESGDDLAEAYVAGTLPEAEQDAFEQHFFGCAACLARVQMLQEIKDGRRRFPPATASYRPAPPPASLAAPWLGLAVAAGVIAAAGWWWHGSSAPPPVPPSANEPIEAPTRQAQLAQLAVVVPPRYVPSEARRAAPAAGSFDAAMAHYAAGRHSEAAAALRALAESAPMDPGIGFFWGISELAQGRADGAREGLTRAIAAGVQPYADEAHFYLAKVYLLEGAVDLSRGELQYAVEHDAGPEGEAQRMLAALDRLPK